MRTHYEILEVTCSATQEEIRRAFRKKLNLWGKIYHRDFTPICKTCSCNTCKNYSRSYIHHLLGVHEISALILLAEHNTHQFKKMLEEVHVNRTHGTE